MMTTGKKKMSSTQELIFGLEILYHRLDAIFHCIMQKGIRLHDIQLSIF